MELVNEFILLSYDTNVDIDSSSFNITKDENYIHLSFRLFSKECLFELDGKSYQVYIRISKSYFEKYNDDFSVEILEQTICCNMQSHLWEIINCKLTGIVRKIFLESQILFLLCRAQRNGYNSGCETCFFSNKGIEIDKIMKAKNFILENLDKNITIPVIANKIGTNECYLKKGFKEVFQKTIFDFIQENRMLKAKHLLETKNMSITDVAFNVGYSSLSSFSQAYKNYFGISPTEHIKQLTNFS